MTSGRQHASVTVVQAVLTEELEDGLGGGGVGRLEGRVGSGGLLGVGGSECLLELCEVGRDLFHGAVVGGR
jgi:hypothetical protein